LFLLVVGMGQYLKLLNRRQEARRVAMGLPANIKDISLMSVAEADKYRIELEQMMRASGVDAGHFNDQAFDDLTDFENPSFMYVI